jgi:hypothetical protein
VLSEATVRGAAELKNAQLKCCAVTQELEEVTILLQRNFPALSLPNEASKRDKKWPLSHFHLPKLMQIL